MSEQGKYQSTQDEWTDFREGAFRIARTVLFKPCRLSPNFSNSLVLLHRLNFRLWRTVQGCGPGVLIGMTNLNGVGARIKTRSDRLSEVTTSDTLGGWQHAVLAEIEDRRDDRAPVALSQPP